MAREPQAPAPALHLGLSLAHKWPLGIEAHPGDFLISAPVNGGCCRVSEVGRPKPGRKNGGTRGEVKGFSSSSRRRQLETINQINKKKIKGIIFDTLTLPEGEGTWADLERWRRAFMKRFHRKWSKYNYFIVWKKELTEKFTPHLHLLIFWLDEPPHMVKEFRPWNDRAWARVVKSKNIHHERCGCNTQLMKSWNGVVYYCAKYLAKNQQGLRSATGRIWGVERRDLLNSAVDVEMKVVSPEVGKRVRRACRKLQERKREKWFVQVDGSWHRIWPQREQTAAGRVVVNTVENQIRIARMCGYRLKRSRPRCCRTKESNIWAEVEDSASPRRKTIELQGTEKHAYAPALHFISGETVLKLADYFEQSIVPF